LNLYKKHRGPGWDAPPDSVWQEKYAADESLAQQWWQYHEFYESKIDHLVSHFRAGDAVSGFIPDIVDSTHRALQLQAYNIAKRLTSRTDSSESQRHDAQEQLQKAWDKFPNF